MLVVDATAPVLAMPIDRDIPDFRYWRTGTYVRPDGMSELAAADAVAQLPFWHRPHDGDVAEVESHQAEAAEPWNEIDGFDAIDLVARLFRNVRAGRSYAEAMIAQLARPICLTNGDVARQWIVTANKWRPNQHGWRHVAVRASDVTGSWQHDMGVVAIDAHRVASVWVARRSNYNPAHHGPRT